MGLFIICLMKEKLFGTKDLGPTSTPCLFFLKTLQNQTEYKTNNNTTKTGNTEDIETCHEKNVTNYECKQT